MKSHIHQIILVSLFLLIGLLVIRGKASAVVMNANGGVHALYHRNP